MALTSAEQLQKGMEEFKEQVRRDQHKEDRRLEEVLKEKEALEVAVEDLKLQVSKLQTRLKNINKDLVFERDSVKRCVE